MARRSKSGDHLAVDTAELEKSAPPMPQADDVLWVPTATQSSSQEILPLRVRHREEMNCQIVYDSIHRREGWTEKIVFHDKQTTMLSSNEATLRCITSEKETRRSIEQQQGGMEWQLEVRGEVAATGGLMFHYNRPYVDIYMDVSEPFRHRGYGSYLVQELKRAAYELGCIPCARCNPTNIASRKTLQKAGFAPCANILNGTIHGLE